MFEVYCDCHQQREIIGTREEAEARAIERAGMRGCPCHILEAGSSTHVATVTPNSNGFENGYRGYPVSTYTILSALEGRDGAWTKLALYTGLRSLMILPGLWLAGIRGPKLFAGSLLGSAMMTGFLLGYYALIHDRNQGG